MTATGKKLLVIDVAALSHGFEIEGLRSQTIHSVFPAVTCTVQASFRTASLPEKHGMVANGIFFRPLNRPLFWEQSARLVSGARIWENFRKTGKRVAMLFWQQSLGEDVDIILSPAPIHRHGGGIIQGCYSQPTRLYQYLCRRIGRPFKLRQYWGPLASWKVGEWIVDATLAVLEEPDMAPDLCFTYLPTIDYALQRENPDNGPGAGLAREKLKSQLSRLVRGAQARAYDTLIFGDYHIVPVRDAVLPNLALRQAGLMNVRVVKGMIYPDFHTSKAFAVADHEIAHVYVPCAGDAPAVEKVLKNMDGTDTVLDRKAQAAMGLNHANSGEFVLIAEQGKWLAYPWWLKRSDAPEYAGHVDIHNKPGYDPCELFFGWPPGTVTQDKTKIQGSHGQVGNGREVTWAASFSVPNQPADLVELAAAVQCWLDEGR